MQKNKKIKNQKLTIQQGVTIVTDMKNPHTGISEITHCGTRHLQINKLGYRSHGCTY